MSGCVDGVPQSLYLPTHGPAYGIIDFRRCDMKHEVRVDPQTELALVRFKGRVDLEGLFGVLRALPEAGFKPGYKILWDAQAVRRAVVRPGDLERLMRHYAELVDSTNGHVQEAAVVNRPLDHSVAQLYRELARRRGYDVGVCWKPDEALDCLGLEELPEVLQRQSSTPPTPTG